MIPDLDIWRTDHYGFVVDYLAEAVRGLCQTNLSRHAKGAGLRRSGR